ncbi:HD domain-containing protein, partial [Winogradskyella sp.]|nr:HD domain-containing protein [Winogradskyella sp.]
MENIIIAVEKYVITYLNNNLDASFVYHNVAHTQRVVKKVDELTTESTLTDTEKQQLKIAAWFHDIGFTKTIEDHEKESVTIATAFLESHNISIEHINTIS